MKITHLTRIAVAAALAGGVAAGASAQMSSANYKMVQSVLNNGVGDMASASYKVSSSLGDPFFTGPIASTSYKISPGFWFGGSAAAPLFLNAVSRKPHGAVTFDLPLAP